jgi:hypothetical protein
VAALTLNTAKYCLFYSNSEYTNTSKMQNVTIQLMNSRATAHCTIQILSTAAGGLLISGLSIAYRGKE